MKPPVPSEPCLIEIRVLGVHMRASGLLAVIVAGTLFIVYLGYRLI
jgi:hypothetical protein